MISFKPTEEEVGERLDVVLAARAGVTRSGAQRALKTGAVTVAGIAVRPSHRLVADELVEGEVPSSELGIPQPEAIPVAVRYRDERVLVVSKPAGLVTHPARGHERGTLVNALLALGEPLSGAASTRPGIVHRLDRDTSGLLVVAKDEDAHRFLLDAMRERQVERRYAALVRGRPQAARGTIDAPIGRHRFRRTRMAVVAEGRPAVTHYRELAAADEATAVEATLETGRTHQIRVHLSHIGHPVLGDKTYGGGGEVAARIGLTRPFLHAWRLAFPHPDGSRVVSVDDPLPPDLVAALERAGIEPSSVTPPD